MVNRYRSVTSPNVPRIAAQLLGPFAAIKVREITRGGEKQGN
jgi:hypothetical protein